MKVTRLDLDGTGSPLGLVMKILQAEPELPIPVPIEELAGALDISEIEELDTDSFEGGLVTDEARSFGGILVRKGVLRGRRRFTIGHELGHFLIPTHVLPSTGQFLCSSKDMRRWSSKEQDQAARFEVEANKFAAGILMPAPHLKKLLRGRDPDLSGILEVHEHFDVSREAAARAYVNFHGAAVAVLVLKDARIIRLYKAMTFPRTCVRVGDEVPSSVSKVTPTNSEGVPTKILRARSEDWLETDWGVRLPAMYQQLLPQRDGYMLALLWCELIDEDDFDPDEDKTAKQRYRDQAARYDPYLR